MDDEQQRQRKRQQPQSRPPSRQERTGRRGRGNGGGHVVGGRNGGGRGGRGKSGQGHRDHGRGRSNGGRGRGHGYGRGVRHGDRRQHVELVSRTVSGPIINASELPQSINVTYTSDWDVVDQWLTDNKLVRPGIQNGDKDETSHTLDSPIPLGFDVETRPRFTSEDAANYRGPDVLQLGLASGSCIVIHLKFVPRDPKSDGWQHLQDVLSDPSILKVGVSLENDVLDLWATFGIRTRGRFDLFDDWLREGVTVRKHQHEKAEEARVSDRVKDMLDKSGTTETPATSQKTNSASKAKPPNFKSLLGKTPLGALHEWAQKLQRPSPIFAILQGQEKNQYISKVTIDGYGVVASGEGQGVKNAKLSSAKNALMILLPGITFYDATNTVASVPGVTEIAKRPFVDPVFLNGHGLKGITETLVPGLQHPKRKKLQMSNWSLPNLSDEQILYAAMDAYVAAAAVDYVSRGQQRAIDQKRSSISPLDLKSIVEVRIVSEVDVEVLENQKQRRKQERQQRKTSSVED